MGVKLPFSMYYLALSKPLGFRQRKRQLTQIYAQKAKAAISNLRTNKQIISTSTSWSTDGQAVRFLSHDFAWTEKKFPDSTEIYLKYDLNNSCWIIEAHRGETSEDENQYVIDIFPSWGHENWVLGTVRVKLCAKNLDAQVFTALWKAFEEKLIEVTGMADLVQLSGYYQYNARISSVLTFNPSLKIDMFWRIVQCVVRGIGVATQLSTQGLAALWVVKTEDVFSYLLFLRSLGYEVRNYSTNPQISKGECLIPYAFPTLTSRSVQLRKSLGNSND